MIDTQNPYEVYKAVMEIQLEASKIVCDAHQKCSNKKLIFPKYRNDGTRVSEQEYRVSWIISMETKVNQHRFLYSVETPTQNTHCNTGISSRSGNSDMSLYDAQRKKFLNIEFKSYQQGQNEVSFDIKKLRTDGVISCWFNLYPSLRKSSMIKLFKKFIVAFEEQGEPLDPLFFSFCFLKSRQLYTTTILDPKIFGQPRLIFDYALFSSAVEHTSNKNPWFLKQL